MADKKPKKKNPDFIWFPVMVGAGVAIGAAMNNIAVGLAIGVGLGLVFSGMATKKKKPKDTDQTA